MYTLGINAVFHDSSACLVEDGFPIAAAEEERFTGIKHGKRPVPFSTYELPYHAIDYCLAAAGIRLVDVDHVAYSFDPQLLLAGGQSSFTLPFEPSAHQPSEVDQSPWDPLFLSYVMNAPRQLADGVPHHLRERFRDARPEGGPYEWHYVEHHLTHAASAFLPSHYERAAVLTLDGRGELATTTYGLGHHSTIDPIGDVRLPHSLGLLYERVTEYLGFLHSSDEYKVMALASFGKPSFLPEFRSIVSLADGGQYRVAPLRLEERFGPPRRRGGPLEQRHFDIARSLQDVLEETVLELTHWLHSETHERALCLAGGVALNCVMNARLQRDGPFRDVWVQPAAGDAGTALGAALWVDARERGATESAYEMTDAFLGPAYEDDELEAFLDWTGAPFRRAGDLVEEVAQALAEDRIIGWFQGRMEFGPRALGARSILASPRSPSMQARLNDIKDREDFRPVAPAVLEEEAADWFDTSDSRGSSPFMLFVYPVRADRADQVPAIRHVDGTARIQTVRRDQHALYYDLIKAFHQRTGVPVLVNTSFNVRGKPIVASPRQALEAFWTTPIDMLVMGPFIIEKPRTEERAQP